MQKSWRKTRNLKTKQEYILGGYRLSESTQNMKGGSNMRFNVELLLENEIIPKDKNRVFLSFLKHNYSSYDNEYFESQIGRAHV